MEGTRKQGPYGKQERQRQIMPPGNRLVEAGLLNSGRDWKPEADKAG